MDLGDPLDDKSLEFEYNERVGDTGVSQFRQFAWLERSKIWPELPAKKWRPRKVIGKGTYGLCGLWEYIGNNNSMPRQMAVKQTSGKSRSLRGESKMMHLVTSTGTDHCVKLYKGCHRGQGTGIDEKYDPLPFSNSGLYLKEKEVLRLYMEYLPNGDLDDLVWNIQCQENWVIPEEHLWRMLLCYAKFCMVLEYGTEDPDAAPVQVLINTTPAPNTVQSPWRPICHFDIKPNNIFVGDRDKTEHRRLEVFKLGDFGLSRFAPLTRADRADNPWIKGSQWRAARQWMSPEQFFENHRNRDISSATNVWAAGAVLHRLITEEPLDPTSLFVHRADPSPGELPQEITGEPTILFDNKKCPYSSTFINLLCRCIAYDPADRIPVKELLKQTKEVIASYDSIRNRPSPSIHSLVEGNNAASNILPPGTALQNFTMPPITKSMPKNAPGGVPIFPGMETQVTALSPDRVAWQLKLKRAMAPRPVEPENYPYKYLGASPVNPAAPQTKPKPGDDIPPRIMNIMQGLGFI